VGAQAGLLERVGDHGGVGEQVVADVLTEGGQLPRPVAGGVGASGAIAFMALSGVPLDRLRATPVAPAPQPNPSTATVQ
jgi:hypothetical protein